MPRYYENIIFLNVFLKCMFIVALLKLNSLARIHGRRFIIELYETARKANDITSLTCKAAQNINRKVKEEPVVIKRSIC